MTPNDDDQPRSLEIRRLIARMRELREPGALNDSTREELEALQQSLSSLSDAVDESLRNEDET